MEEGKGEDGAAPLDSEAEERDLVTAASTILEDLSTAIELTHACYTVRGYLL